ncbi:cysteine--tRNA ligase [uncultured Sunxiuqinia sp.]|uniref:cysteine--tRNA ligase n=1 Tax=uncultured Sunxiuqinia sp. TaxID=1573825 RepID=UPI002AA93A87|nr:cysteine--tRNA ligase [uncultured Sunxiuqinia sp.]
MENQLQIYNTLSRKKEVFEPLHTGKVGLYVCGPTVYGKAHLGHARPAVTYDLLFRYLKHIGYKVRYVRNITDVGHLANDADEGEDKIAKKARLDELEPMEVVQIYTNDYHKNMQMLNALPPSIEPRATGHIIEQIQTVEQILAAGYAYESNGSVYFDVEKYAKDYPYGELSGRKIEDLQCNTRVLDGQDEKRSSLDFAIWKKASPEHIMRWPSKWSDGFPGWHLECTAMSCKYLGETFDIHGGGMDLTFPHHEAEIAQAKAAHGKDAVRYWMHNNMITLNGQKMGKSLGNAISLEEFFTGKHSLLEKAYNPMTIRFFMLMAHYRSTLDFSNEALQAAEKGMERLLKAIETLDKLEAKADSTVDVKSIGDKCYEAMNDDLNSPIAIAHLFDGVKMINSIADGKASISAGDLEQLKSLYNTFIFELFGLKKAEEQSSSNNKAYEHAIDLLLQLRMEAKANKDWATSDKIRDELSKLGFEVKDTKDGFSWELK